MNITNIRHAWREKKGFTINRPKGLKEYTFLHFINGVNLLCGDKICALKPHACIMYSPDTPQWFESDVPLIHDWMHMTLGSENELSDLGIKADTVYYPSDYKFITPIMCEIETEFHSGRIYGNRLIKAKTDELFIKLSRSFDEYYIVPSVSSETEFLFRKLRSEMLSRTDGDWSIEAMARSVSLSPSRFFVIYRSLYGISPVDDLIHARIDAAKNYLSGSELSFTNIASILGYANITHFFRQFKQLTGVTPGQYRNSISRP